jgi:hypothetical protein
MPAKVNVPAEDLDRFKSLVDEFAECLLSDVAYSTSMVQKANAIIAKRELWALRLRYRELSCTKLAKYEASGWTLKNAVALMETYVTR